MSDIDASNIAAHEQTYRGFLKLLQRGTIGVIIVLLLMAVFLV